MKTAYFDCFSGISGDMCLGALVDAGVPIEKLQNSLAQLDVPGFRLAADKVLRSGIGASHVKVMMDEAEHHPHRGLHTILRIIEDSGLPAGVVQRSSAVFQALGEAEAHVHRTDVDHVHFHEVGAVDAICDIVGTAIGLAHLGIEKVLFSTIRLGGGTVKAAHGTLPVPAPATAELVKGLPSEGGPVDVELTTPTGAAILRALGEPHPSWPAMSVQKVGYGAGTREMDHHPNVLRLAIGDTPPKTGAGSDCIWVLDTNLDDMTGEEIGYCTEKLMQAGALDAFTTSIQMKKGRPGVRLTVLCEPAELAQMEGAIWKHTSTLGIRRTFSQRSKLGRETERIETPWGPVDVKIAYLGDDVVRREPEYEDCRAIAEAHGVSLREVYRAALRG